MTSHRETIHLSFGSVAHMPGADVVGDLKRRLGSQFEVKARGDNAVDISWDSTKGRIGTFFERFGVNADAQMSILETTTRGIRYTNG